MFSRLLSWAKSNGIMHANMMLLRCVPTAAHWQACWRGRRIRKLFRAMYLKATAAAMRIQALARGIATRRYIAYHKWLAMTSAAIRFQSAYRGLLGRCVSSSHRCCPCIFSRGASGDLGFALLTQALVHSATSFVWHCYMIAVLLKSLHWHHDGGTATAGH